MLDDLSDTLGNELCTTEFCARQSVVLISAVCSAVKGVHDRELCVAEYYAWQSAVLGSAVNSAVKGARDRDLCTAKHCAQQ
ncbi:hypothetical protein AMTR_s00075p00085130 [Amborella trichopoda]|uniref:Uncharacterized protein n=1 Tax=Amborella trichopoda TaxID=13333 RepID=W1P9I0_AMBTC|nr:hypothetical protein AMTR_s00075p00085130 [Amborella trichopoda]